MVLRRRGYIGVRVEHGQLAEAYLYYDGQPLDAALREAALS